MTNRIYLIINENLKLGVSNQNVQLFHFVASHCL
jgi:hypothetical protein